jgi:hypothetical protein
MQVIKLIFAKANVEKQQEELNRFTNAINTGSFYVPRKRVYKKVL